MISRGWGAAYRDVPVEPREQGDALNVRGADKRAELVDRSTPGSTQVFHYGGHPRVATQQEAVFEVPRTEKGRLTEVPCLHFAGPTLFISPHFFTFYRSHTSPLLSVVLGCRERSYHDDL